MPNGNTNIQGNIRKKRGETKREIIRMLIEKPRVSILEIADSIGCTYENVRVAFEKLKHKPESAALFGFSEEAVRSAIVCRSTKTIAKKKLPWRGKANWPVSVRNISPFAAALWCGQEYDFVKPGLYVFNERAGLRPDGLPKYLRFF